MVAIVVLAMVGLAATGCRQPPGPPDDTAVVELDGARYRIQLDSCGRDGATVFLVGSGDGAALQAVVGLDAKRRGLLASSAVTLDRPGGVPQVGAFGAESATRRGGIGRPPGRVERASLRRDRVRLEAEVEELGDGQAATGRRVGTLTLDARCPPR